MAESLGARLRSLREKQNISQAELARTTGIEQTAISRIEVRKDYNPSAAVLYKIAKALGTTSDALLEGLVEWKPVSVSQNGLAERFGNEIALLHKGQAETAQALGEVSKALGRLNERLESIEKPKARR